MRRMAWSLALLLPLAAPAAVLEAPGLSRPGLIGTPTLGPSAAPSLTAASLVPAPTAALLSVSAVALPPSVPPALVAPAPAFVGAASAPAPRLSAASASGSSSRGPPSGRGSAFAASLPARVAETVASWAVPVERILAEHQVLLVGENHGSLSSVKALAENMPRLAKAGVTAVGIEGLKRPQQAAVDAYLSGRADDLPEEVLAFSPRRRQAFRALLDAARAQGVRVVALGLPLDGWARQAAELAAAKTGEPVEVFLGTPAEQLQRAQTRYEPGFNEAVAEVYLTRRNEAMAEFLSAAVGPKGKAVALVGQAHAESVDLIPGRLMNAAGDWGTMARELAKRSLKAFSLMMTGGLYVDAESALDDRLARPAAHNAAATASPEGSSAWVSLGESLGLWHAGGRVPAPVAH